MPKAISLFTGCGGSDAGLIAAGFEVVMANDFLPYAAEVYSANLPETDYVISNICDVKKFPRADLLVGCYPCQGFSQGGARDVGRDVNYLFREFGRALRKVRPKAFVVENVSGLTRADNKQLFDMQLRNFRAAGYSVTWRLLNAANFGVPQERLRVIIVGVRTSLGIKYEFPKPTHGTQRRPFITIADALKGLPSWPAGEFNDEPFHWYYMSRDRRRNWNEVSKTIVSRARHMPLHPISPRMVRVGPDCYRFESRARARRFSYREAAVLQGFSRDLVFPDSCGMYTRYKVVGNAVPPPLFAAVARSLKNVVQA